MIASTSSAWPLPSTPAMPTTSPSRTVEADVVDQRTTLDVGTVTAQLEHGGLATVEARVSGEGSSAPTISSASWRAVVVFGSAVADGRAAADDRDRVGDLADLVELVRDEEDRQALARELGQVAEQLVDLLRHEDRGRLVEDQDAGAAVEHLGDLDPLAVTDAEVLDEHVGVEAEAVAVGDLARSGGGPRRGPAGRPWSARCPGRCSPGR